MLVLLVLPDPPTGVELPLEVVEVVVGVALGADGRVPPAAERREVIILSIKSEILTCIINDLQHNVSCHYTNVK